MTAVKTLNSFNFQSEVLQSEQTVVVDFWAVWCGPCRMISPIIEELAVEYAGKVTMGKLNVDENRQLAMDYGVMGIPTVLVFKGGKVVERAVGYRQKKDLSQLIDRYL